MAVPTRLVAALVLAVAAALAWRFFWSRRARGRAERRYGRPWAEWTGADWAAEVGYGALAYAIGASLWAAGSALLDPAAAGATVEVVDVVSLAVAVVGVLQATAVGALAWLGLFVIGYPVYRVVRYVDRQDAELAREREAARDRRRTAPPG